MSLEGILIGLLAIGVGLAWAFYGLKLFVILLPIWAFFFGLVTGAQWAGVFGKGGVLHRRFVDHRHRVRPRARGDRVLLVLRRRRDHGRGARLHARCRLLRWLGFGTDLLASWSACSSARSSPSRHSFSGFRHCWSSSSQRSAARPRSSMASASCSGRQASGSTPASSTASSSRASSGSSRDRRRGAGDLVPAPGRRAHGRLGRPGGLSLLAHRGRPDHRAAVARRRHRPGDDEQPLHPVRPVGAVVASHQLEHAQITPRPGWVEHDADEILERVRTCVRVALREAGRGAGARRGGDQRPARDDRRVGSADRAAGPQRDRLAGHPDRRGRARLAAGGPGGIDRFRAKTGLPISTYSSALKLAWILEEGGPERGPRRRPGDLLFGTIDTLADLAADRRRRGGVHVTDVTNASRTMLMDLETLAWDPALLDGGRHPGGDAPRDPRARPRSTARAAATRRRADRRRPRRPAGGAVRPDLLRGRARRSARTARAASCWCTPGSGRSSRGTASSRPWPRGSATAPATYALEGSVAVAGSLIQWLRDNLGIIADAAEVEALARSVPD